jgi:hypothetical protein
MNGIQALLRKFKEPQFMGKLLIFLLVAGLALLFVEVRFEHQAVLGKRWQAWIPLVYCGSLVLTGPAGLVLWNRGGRILLLAFFLSPRLLELQASGFTVKVIHGELFVMS